MGKFEWKLLPSVVIDIINFLTNLISSVFSAYNSFQADYSWPTSAVQSRERRRSFEGEVISDDSPSHLPTLLTRKPFRHSHLNDPSELIHFPFSQASAFSSHSSISANGKRIFLWRQRETFSFNLPRHRLPIKRNPVWQSHVASVELSCLMHNCSHFCASWISHCCSDPDECFNFGLICLHVGLLPNQRRFLHIKFLFLINVFRLELLINL